MIGVIGIGLGLWWLDAAAAIIISLDITKDGVTNLKAATGDLMDSRPTVTDDSQLNPLPERLRSEVESPEWVSDCAVRVREEGRVFFADVQVVPSTDAERAVKIERAVHELKAIDWRLNELVIMPVTKLEPPDDAVAGQ